MKYRMMIGCAALAALCGFLASQAISQDGGSGGMPAMDSPEMQEAMAMWMELSAPGEQHENLAARAGKWTTKSKAWWSGQDGPVMEEEGTSEIKAMYGGRWIVEKMNGQMMGMPFEGFGMTGFDNYKQKFVSVWVDSISTAMFVIEGTADPSGKIITMWGRMDEPMTGERNKLFKTVLRHVNDDHFVFEMHDMVFPEGKTKVMEISYHRQ